MKVLYWVLGLAVVGSVGYTAYQYGAGNWSLPERDTTNNTATNNTTTNNTTIPTIDWPVFNNTTNNTTDVGTKSLTIASPKNGQIIQLGSDIAETFSFYVTGTVSPNATKIRVQNYATSLWTGLEEAASEKLIDDYYLTKFKLGDTSWSYKATRTNGEIAGNVQGTSARFVVTATYTDNSTKSAQVGVAYNWPESGAEMGKPVIYLYPTQTQQVSVNVKPTSGVSYSEPVIGNGWQVTANPDGTLVDASGKTWPYLFWEGFATNFVTPKEGFVVAQAEVGKFFDEKLGVLGLNAKEIADFKEFWMPRMQDKPYYFVTFIPQKTFDSYAPLTVAPAPDTIIRVFFDYKGLDTLMKVPTQILPKTPERTGFTLVEWGGRIYR